MPTAALKHLAKKAKVSPERAEHLWDKSKEVVDAQYDYDEKDDRYWALRMGITKKMLGLGERVSFSEFLMLEGAVKSEPKFKKLNVAGAVKLLNSKCKNALWMLTENKPIYRGDTVLGGRKDLIEHGFAVVNTTATERRSANTSNHYTVILDNHPDRQDFPKRSRSFIGSTSESRAKDYSWHGTGGLFAVIPTDDAKIGVVNKSDMWDTRIKLFGRSASIEKFNYYFEQMGIQATIESFEKFAEKVKDINSKEFREFYLTFKRTAALQYKDSFMKEIWKAYSAEQTGHTLHTTSTLPHNLGNIEVWVGGEVVMITYDMWQKLREAIKK